MKKTRIQDIARSADVSPATVTRVLRGNGYVSAEKRELVLQVAKELHYNFSQDTAEKGVPQILIFSPPSSPESNWLFANISENICMEFQKIGWYSITYYAIQGSLNEIIRIIDSVQHLNLKGIIFNCLDFNEDLSAFRKLLTSLSIPVLMIERFPDVFNLNKIMINAKEATFLAVNHLYKYGHRKIAFFALNNQQEVEISRIEGFNRAVQAMELEQSAHFMSITGYTKKDGLTAMESYAETYGLPTAIIAPDPVMVGISQYLYEHNLRIPDDVSLIGLDDSIASMMTPPLTSIAFPVRDITYHTVQFFTEGKEKLHLSKTISLSTYMIKRGSVAPPKE